MSDDSPNIPTVDLADLVHHDRAVRTAAAAQIKEGFATYGLLYVTSHGVDMERCERLYARFVELTNRPREEKEKLGRPDLWFQRGWTPPNTEKAVVAGGQPDFKECYFAAPLPVDPECRLEYPEIYSDNVWPEDSQELADEYLTVGYELHEAGLCLLQGVAMALGLPSKTFDRKLEGAAHVFRMLRYLPLTQEQIDAKILWGEEHTDFNLLTLLPGGRFLDPNDKPCARPDDASGLYLRTRPTKEHPNGVMVRGRPPEGCIVAQVGQQLEILTGGQMQATPHVITAPKTPGYARVSAAHFLHLHAHQIVSPLERFRTEAAVRAYSPPVLAGTYSIKTLVDIGLAPRAALEKLGYRHYGRLAELRA
jgi:isopenicillin N synthase-like dioxygenase